MQNFSLAIEQIDKLMKFFPDHDRFAIADIIEKTDWKHSEKLLAEDNDAIEIMLEKDLGYAEGVGNTNLYFKLTPLGREVKKAGGHFAYQALIDQSHKAELERQALSDKKLNAELDIAEFERDFGKRIKTWGFGIAVLTFLLSSVIPLFLLLKPTPVSPSEELDRLRSHVDTLNQRLINTEKQINLLEEKLQRDTTHR